MKNRLRTFGILLVVIALATPCVFGQTPEEGFQDSRTTKRAQTGMKFLGLSMSPRAAAMGSAVTALQINSSVALLYNPAAMASMSGTFDVAAMQTQWVADIAYNGGTVGFRPMDGQYGVVGVSLVSVDYGTFIGTVRSSATNSGYIETQNFSPTAMALGVGYARALTDRFSVGGQAKYVMQDLGSFPISGSAGDFERKDYSISTVAFDFGIIYETGFRSLTFAFSTRNFSRALKYEEENFELPLHFRIGVAMDLIDLTSLNPNMHSLTVAVDATRPRDYAENVTIGGEYLFMNTLALRAGYTYPSKLRGLNLGVGLQQEISGLGFAFNYAYTSFDVFDNVHRLGIHLSL